jgi:hypothetical protein
MPNRFRHIHTQLTLKYTGIVGLLLLLLGGVNLAYQYEYLRRQLDQNLREDLEIVEDILLTNQTVVNPLDVISDHQPQPFERFVEIWSDSGALLYHSSAFKLLSSPPPPRAGRYSEVPTYSSHEFPDGGRWRTIGVLVATPHQRRVVRISMSEEHLRSQILEMMKFL